MERIKPISFKDLKRIFKCREFTRRLTQAANETLEYWDETQFNIVRTLFDDKLFFGNVVADPDVLDKPHRSTRGGFLCGVEDLIEKENYDIYSDEIFPLIVYHTHTPPKNSSDPSPHDLINMALLRLFNYDSEFGYRHDNKLLYIIGSLPDKQKLDLLVLQEKLDAPIGVSIAKNIADFVETHPDYDPTDNKVIARLYDSRAELNATLLTYRRKNGIFRISEEELQKLERFAYSPRLLQKET